MSCKLFYSTLALLFHLSGVAQSMCLSFEGSLDNIPDSVVSTMSMEELVPLVSKGYRTTVFKKEMGLFAYTNCKSNWYTYNEFDGWQNQYKLDNHGFTCNALLFLDSLTPQLIGGYGLWKGQGLNIYLKEGEWFSKDAQSHIDYYNPSFAFLSERNEKVLMGGFFENDLSNYREHVGTNCFVLNPNGKYEKRTSNIYSSETKVNYTRIFNNDYIVSIGKIEKECHIVVQDLRTHKIVQDFVRITPIGNSAYLLSDDVLTIFDANKRKSIINLTRLCIEGEQIILKKEWGLTSCFILIFLVVLIVLVAFALVYKNKQEPEFYKALIKTKAEILDVDEMNAFLALDNFSYDKTRRRRSEIIKNINEYHQLRFNSILISREKDKSDERRIVYRINRSGLKRPIAGIIELLLKHKSARFVQKNE